MATLDVLDYQVGLEEALAKPGPEGRPLLEPPLRRQAIKEARRVIDMLAFRFALLDERALPEDLDYLRALEGVKAPERAAPVLARRRPTYAAKRRQRLTTTWSILAILALVIAGGWWLATSEEVAFRTEIVHSVARDDPTGGTSTLNRTFEVTPDVNRLHVDGTIIVHGDSPGVIEVRLLDPQGRTVIYDQRHAMSGNYLRENVLDPEPGTWVLIVDFLDVDGSARVMVDGVRPAR